MDGHRPDNPKAFEEALAELQKSDGNVLTLENGKNISSLTEEERDEIDGLDPAERSLARKKLLKDRMPRNSQEALDKFSRNDEDDEDEDDLHESIPDEEVEDLYKAFERQSSGLETEAVAQHAQAWEQQARAAQQALYAREQELQALREQTMQFQQERNAAEEYDLSLRLRDAYLENDADAITRATNALMNFNIQKHNNALLMAQSMQQPMQQPMQYPMYASNPMQQQSFQQNIGGYQTLSHPKPYVAGGEPPPTFTKTAPRKTSKTAAPSSAPSHSSKSSTDILKTADKRLIKMAQSMDLRGADGQLLSLADRLRVINEM